MSGKEAKRYDPFVHYGVAASLEAFKDSRYGSFSQSHGKRFESGDSEADGEQEGASDQPADVAAASRSGTAMATWLRRPIIFLVSDWVMRQLMAARKMKSNASY